MAVLAIVAALSFVGGPVLASNHTGIVPDGWHFQQNLAEHGEHPAWERLAEDVLATAKPYRASNATVNALATAIEADLPTIASLPAEAFHNVEVPAHYEVVHPFSDRVANLAALLTTMDATAPAVANLNATIPLVMATHATDAICGYESWLAAQNNATNGPQEWLSANKMAHLWLDTLALVMLIVFFLRSARKEALAHTATA